MGQKRTHKKYTKEFKEEAVALVLEQGDPVAQAPKSLGVGISLLYKWKEKIEAKREGVPLVKDEREELKRLRKEVKELRIEKEILKRPAPSLRRK